MSKRAELAARGPVVLEARRVAPGFEESPPVLRENSGAQGLMCSGPLSTFVHPALAEEQPVEGHGLLGGEGDQEVCVRCRAVFVAIYVLLKDAKIACELALGSVASHLRKPIRELLLES